MRHMVWTTKNGEVMNLSDMSIQHLIRALKYNDRKKTIARLKGYGKGSIEFNQIARVQGMLEAELERRNRKSFDKDCKFL